MNQRCELCSIQAPDVAVGLVRWRDPLPGQTFDKIWRCRDRVSCRDRCEAQGDIWPVDDGTPATVARALG